MGVIRSYTRKVGISLRGDSKSGVALGIIGVAPRDGEKVVALRVGEKGEPVFCGIYHGCHQGRTQDYM